MNFTQSAGNLPIRKRSNTSGTTCGTSFNYTIFNRLYLEMFGRPAPDFNWLTWFVGFREGDGALLIQKGFPYFVLTQKEGAILYHIQRVLGFGQVRYFAEGNYFRFSVYDKANILLLAHLFNGNLVLQHRITQIQSWLIYLGGITPIWTSPMVTLCDRWLSGFTDAEGCFNVGINKAGTSVSLRFILDQKNAERLFYHLKFLFGYGNINLRGTTNGVYRFTIGSFTRLKPVCDYFHAFPLKSKKGLSFSKWYNIYNLVARKSHKTRAGIANIRTLAKDINLLILLIRKADSAHP